MATQEEICAVAGDVIAAIPAMDYTEAQLSATLNVIIEAVKSMKARGMI